MATFTASVPLNMSWRVRGRTVEIVQDKAAGIPLPAGTEFDVPDDLADEFETDFGPTPQGDRLVPHGSGWWTTEPQPDAARIQGLTRL